MKNIETENRDIVFISVAYMWVSPSVFGSVKWDTWKPYSQNRRRAHVLSPLLFRRPPLLRRTTLRSPKQSDLLFKGSLDFYSIKINADVHFHSVPVDCYLILLFKL